MGLDLIVRVVVVLAALVFLWWVFERRQSMPIAAAIVALVVLGLVFFRVEEMEPIKLPADVVFQIGPWGITNSVLATWVTMIVLVVASWLATRHMQLVPHGLQNFMEAIVEALHDIVRSATDSRDKTNAFFPLVATLFLFIVTANWLGLIPGFTTLEVAPAVAEAGRGAGEHAEAAHRVQLFRPATTDLNTTLALAVISVCMAQYWGIKYLGAGEYRHKFFTFRGGGMGFFVGILEFISELAKFVSFSFRLFGNIFAGEVLLVVLSFLVPFGLTLPFLGLEVFVGFIQAFVFAMLTLVFLVMATAGHGEAHAPEHADPAHADVAAHH